MSAFDKLKIFAKDMLNQFDITLAQNRELGHNT